MVFGGSDAAIIIGKNPYKTTIDLWEEKIGLREAEDISEKPRVKYGTDMEPILRESFKIKNPQYEVRHEEYSIIRHPKYPFLFASLDGQLVDKETGELGILEIKTAEILTYSEDYQATKTYDIFRKDVEQDIKYLEKKEIEFWNNYVVPKKQPPLLLPEF